MAEFSALDVVLNPAGAGTQNDNVVIGRDVLRYVSVFDQIATTTSTGTAIQEVPRTITYYFRGYYVVGTTHEYWQGTSLNIPPPSGHTLLDTTIIRQIQ